MGMTGRKDLVIYHPYEADMYGNQDQPRSPDERSGWSHSHRIERNMIIITYESQIKHRVLGRMRERKNYSTFRGTLSNLIPFQTWAAWGTYCGWGVDPNWVWGVYSCWGTNGCCCCGGWIPWLASILASMGTWAFGAGAEKSASVT